MTENNSFKKQIRLRMKLTGESYSEAYKVLYDPTKKKIFSLEKYFSSSLPSIPVENFTVEHLFSNKELQLANEVINNVKGGLVVFTGSIGSGKTTNLNIFLNSLLEKHPNNFALTLEDPRELKMKAEDRVMSLEKTEDYDYTFMLRKSLRVVPDFISIGELRDKTTGTTVNRLLDYNEFIITSLHSNNLISTVTRLQYLNININNVSAIVEQKRYSINNQQFFLRSIILLTNPIKKVIKEFLEDNDRAKLDEKLIALNVETLDNKIQTLVDKKILVPHIDSLTNYVVNPNI
jgi:Tfp pilus assembly pilus retraction ATPase PilT